MVSEIRHHVQGLFSHGRDVTTGDHEVRAILKAQERVLERRHFELNPVVEWSAERRAQIWVNANDLVRTGQIRVRRVANHRRRHQSLVDKGLRQGHARRRRCY